MDYKLNRPLRHVLLLVLMLQWSWSASAFPTSTDTRCKDVLERTKALTNLLIKEAKDLQTNYTKFHRIINRTSGDVPESSISGTDILEKLQDIYLKSKLFHLHISEVEKYQENVWGDRESVIPRQIKERLNHHFGKISVLLETIKPEVPLPPTPAPPQLSHGHDHAKKVYGWSVIVRLMEWLPQVLQVLEEAKGECNK